MRLDIPSSVAAVALWSATLPSAVAASGQGTTNLLPYPVPGKFVDVGGRRLHINCVGEGSPAVVMEAGAGDFSFDWSLVQPEVAKFTHVCSYDRAGYAWSDGGPMPRSMHQIVAELHLALQKAGIRAPFVLVGQSLGGLLVRMYADQHPNQVAGIVLVDSSHEDDQMMLNNKMVSLRELSRGRAIPPVQLEMPAAAGSNSTEAVRQPQPVATKVEAPYDKLPPDVQQIRLWAVSRPNYADARRSEFDYLSEEVALMHADRIKREYPLGDIPLIILSRGKNVSAGHRKVQEDLVHLSRNSKQIVAVGSDHHIQLDDPKLVIDAIHRVVDAARNHTKLAP